MNNTSELEDRIGYYFTNNKILHVALVHPSYINENPNFTTDSNERLEFLGDSIIGMVISDWLFRQFDKAEEGRLTLAKASLVCQAALSEAANRINLGKHLILGVGEEKNSGRSKASNLSNAYEALIAAVYLDSSFEEARIIVLTTLAENIAKLTNETVLYNHKATLQQYTQAKYRSIPLYRVIQADGTEHDPVFCAEVILNGETVGRGKGRNKKGAETEAAREALLNLKLQDEVA